MSFHALVLADRPAAPLGPLSVRFPPSLLPVGGKAVVEHCLEDLRDAGCSRVVIVAGNAGAALRALVGDGARFGLQLEFVPAAGEEAALQALALARHGASGPLLVARGDVLRGRCARRLVALGGALDGDALVAFDGAQPLGIGLVGPQAAHAGQLRFPLADTTSLGHRARAVELAGSGFSALSSLPAYFAAARSALQGRCEGLQLDGRQLTAGSGWRALRSRVAPDARIDGPVRVGRNATVHSLAQVCGCSEIGDDAVIDAGAEVIDSIVMPGTYVGRGTRLESAIACGPWLYRADLELLQRIEDPLLLAGPQHRDTQPLRVSAR